MEKPQILTLTAKEAVVYKPSGIATQLSNDIKGSSLESILKKQLGKNEIYFPHRLDRITRGLILAAFDKETAAFYSSQIKEGNFSKYYLCRSESKLLDPKFLKGIRKSHIKTVKNKSSVVKSGGKPSFMEIIEIEPASEKNGQYHVLIKLITGRTHQIRVMLADTGMPLCGDFLYNPHSDNKNFYLESIVMKFTGTDGKNRTVYYEENPEREKLSASMLKTITEINSQV